MNMTRILVIEDDTREAASLARVLQTEGYEVVTVERGDEGLKLAQSEPFHLVLTDLRMPGVDGLQLLRQMRALKPRLPIVLMTAFGTTDDIIEATRHGAFEYLRKPFKIEEFLSVVGQAVAAGKLMEEPIERGDSIPGRDALVGSSRVM